MTDVAFHRHGLDHDLTRKENVSSPLAVPVPQTHLPPPARPAGRHRSQPHTHTPGGPDAAAEFAPGHTPSRSCSPQTGADKHNRGERSRAKIFQRTRGRDLSVTGREEHAWWTALPGLHPASLPSLAQSQGQHLSPQGSSCLEPMAFEPRAQEGLRPPGALGEPPRSARQAGWGLRRVVQGAQAACWEQRRLPGLSVPGRD